MKYINIKRIVLNIGLLIFLFAIIFAGYSIYDNRNATYTQATIVSAKPSENMYFQKSDGTHNMYDEITVTYIVDGATYSGKIFKLPDEYEIGQEVRYCYNSSQPEEPSYDTRSGDLILAGILMFISLMIMVICRSAFIGYKKDYLCRYKKSVIFSAVTGWIPILYYLWLAYIFEDTGPFAGFSEFFFMLFLFIFVPIVNIIVWIIAAVKYSRSQAIIEETKGRKE